MAFTTATSEEEGRPFRTVENFRKMEYHLREARKIADAMNYAGTSDDIGKLVRESVQAIRQLEQSKEGG